MAADFVAALRAICLALPETHEEQAWVGTRWRIRKRTFAHVLNIDDGWPGAYSRAASTDGPATVLTFRSAEPELDVLRHAGHPFFPAPWRRDEIGLFLTDQTDLVEVAELVTDSYCIQAPAGLAAQAGRPPHPG